MKPARLLIADDEAPFVQTVSDFLTRHFGYTVSTALSGQQAIQTIKKDQPALVVMDLKFPDLHGGDLISQMRQNSPHTKVIIVTAYHDEGLRERFLRNPEIVGYLFKPLSSLLDLEKQIREALGKPS